QVLQRPGQRAVNLLRGRLHHQAHGAQGGAGVAPHVQAVDAAQVDVVGALLHVAPVALLLLVVEYPAHGLVQLGLVLPLNPLRGLHGHGLHGRGVARPGLIGISRLARGSAGRKSSDGQARDQQHGLAHKGSDYSRATFTFWPVSSAPAALSTSITAVTMPALLTTKPMAFTTPVAETSPALTLTCV